MLSAHSCPLGRLGTRDTGGMSVYVLELARELGRCGHLVDVYTRVHDPKDRLIYELGPNARLIHLRAGEDGEIHKLAVYPHLPDFARHLEDFRRRHHLRYDLIYSHYWLSAWVGRHLQVWWGVPHMVMFHTLGAVKNALGVGETEPELRLRTEECLTKNCHRIVAATPRERESLISYYGAPAENISVIPCGVNLELFRPMDKEAARRELGLDGGKYILFVGRIEPLKGVDKLLQALSYFSGEPKPRLLVIGDENRRDELKRLRKLCRELGIQDLVSFLGVVKQEELPRFYSAADVSVVPSHYESFGLVTLESLACGTPVVATNVGDNENIIRQGQTGYVVPDNTPHLLAERMALLLSRRDNAAELARLARASVMGFGWSTIAQAVIRECQRLLAGEAACRR